MELENLAPHGCRRTEAGSNRRRTLPEDPNHVYELVQLRKECLLFPLFGPCPFCPAALHCPSLSLIRCAPAPSVAHTLRQHARLPGLSQKWWGLWSPRGGSQLARKDGSYLVFFALPVDFCTSPSLFQLATFVPPNQLDDRFYSYNKFYSGEFFRKQTEQDCKSSKTNQNKQTNTNKTKHL